MDLRVTTSTVGGADVVALEGSADLATAPALHAAIARLAPSSGCVFVDLDGVAVLDDVALGLLVGAAARARDHGGTLVVVCSPGRIRDRLAATRIDRILPVTTSIAAHRAANP